MMAMLIRSASMQRINRYNSAGVLYKVSNLVSMERISQYDVIDMRTKRSDLLVNNNRAVAYAYCPMLGVRSFSDKTTPPSSVPPPPHPPNLPDREQVEKAFFRVIAFLWDYGLWLFAWSHRMIKLHIVEKPMVKFYWKRFHEKMEEAKKDS